MLGRWLPVVLVGALAGVAVSTQGPAPQRPAEPIVPSRPRGPMGPPEPKAGELRLAATPDDAVRLALAIVEELPPHDQPFIRFLWIQDGHPASIKSKSFTINTVSRASTTRRPPSVAGGQLLLIDLRLYAPRRQDLEEWLRLWEEFAFDPSFALLITRDNLKFAALAAERATGKELVGPVFFGAVEIDANKVDVIRLNSGAIDPTAFKRLQALTCSEAPVVEHSYFLYRSLSQIQDKGVYKVVWGGLYYKLRGIRKAADVKGKEKATDLDLFLEQRGVGNIAGKLKADQLFDGLRSDQRSVKLRSDITGKPRIGEELPTLAEREGQGKGWITDDIKDEDVDIGDRSYANLLRPRFRAREGIFPGLLLDYVLFNDQGALQDEVPPDVAMDRTIPAPHTQRLQPAIGCIRCHGPHSGWQPFPNDARRLLGGQLDIFDDLSGRNGYREDTIDRLVGLYAGSFDKNLRRAREDYQAAVLRATGPWDGPLIDVAKDVSARVSQEYEAYWYRLVDADVACRELGVIPPRGKAVAVFKLLVQPDVRSATVIDGAVIVPEDPRIGAIAQGLAVNRSDWALAYSFAAERARRSDLYRILRGEIPWFGN